MKMVTRRRSVLAALVLGLSRVPPLQARKMTARVQAATTSGRPVGKVVDLSLQLAFLAGELAMGGR